jgi:hypothetical protein
LDSTFDQELSRVAVDRHRRRFAVRIVLFPALLLLSLCSLFATTASGLSAEMDAEIDAQLGIQLEENSIRSDPAIKHDRLQQDKIVITQLSYRQIFEPYLNADRPIFITSDTVLNAYHVLLMESIGRYEQVNARRLPEILKLLWDQIAPEEEPATKKGDQQRVGIRQEGTSPATAGASSYLEVKRQAEKRARIVIAVAMKLMGDNSIRVDQTLRPVVESEVRRINRAKGLHRPKWIGETDSEYKGLDYSLFQPHGFYARSERLEGYYRAMRWLQSVPFRIHKDEELLSILILGKTLFSQNFSSPADRRKIENFLQCQRDFHGQENARDLLFAAQIIGDRPADLKTVRDYLLPTASNTEDDKSDGGITAIGGQEQIQRTPLSFYIIAPRRLPDIVLFQSTTALQGMHRSWPSGLEICALLDSEFARRQLTANLSAQYRDSLLAKIDRFKDRLVSDSLYNQYLNSVAALLDPPEPDAPAFMFKQTWQIKSCNTVLSSWVQSRNFLPDKIRQTDHTNDETVGELPPGFVEPEPEFFARLYDLIERTKEILERCGAFLAPRHVFAQNLRTFAGLIKNERYPQPAEQKPDLAQPEQSIIDRSIMILSTLDNVRFSTEEYMSQRRKTVARVLSIADEVEKGTYEDEPTYQALVIETSVDLKRLWQTLGNVCRRLEVMAHKQLRGISFNDRETYFLADFGRRLAAVMLYGGGHGPKDDAPAIIVFYSNTRKRGYLHGAVARPRELLVMYPFQGREILCRGAVLPYFEFVSGRLLSGREWLKRLDSDERPASPEWIKSILAPSCPQLAAC